MDFKVGDKVKCIRASLDGYDGKEGEILIVRQDGVGSLLFEEYPQSKLGNDERRFRLLPGGELAELVRQANEGNAAFVKLYNNHFEAVEVLYGSSPEHADRTQTELGRWCNSAMSIRVKKAKPAPVFTVIKAGGWEVSIVGPDDIKVGCKQFKRAELLEALACLIEQGFNNVRSTTTANIFYATMNGVKLEAHVLSWENANTLMGALRTY